MQITLANPTHIHEVMSLFNENLDNKNSLCLKHLVDLRYALLKCYTKLTQQVI